MSSNGTTHQRLDELFPAPSLPPSQLSPQRLLGANSESLVALQEVLKDNHTRHHIFFNDAHFHNHAMHRALAIYAVGGSATTIRDYYERDSRIQRLAIPSPEPITEENFVDHLGDEKFYQSYVSFFSKQVLENGAAHTLEEFIFSEKYNFQSGRDMNTHPEMFARLFEGLVHSMIHVGYGAEFGLKGMLAEGLALAAVHTVRVRGTFPPSFFAPSLANVVQRTSIHLSMLDSATTDIPFISKTGDVHAFDIVAHMLKDDRFNRKDFVDHFTEILIEYSPVVREHSERWTVDLNRPGEIERKIEELIWLCSLLYAVGGLTPNRFRFDFFLMHMVTSSLFLPSLIAYLSPRSQVLLLRGHLSTVLMWWVMRGRPDLDIKAFMTTTLVEPSIPKVLAPSAPLNTTETNPISTSFLSILQAAIVHPNDHYIKIQRAFAHFDSLYGRRPAAYFKGTELEDAELLDGSLFFRASLLTFGGCARARSQGSSVWRAVMREQ